MARTCFFFVLRFTFKKIVGLFFFFCCEPNCLIVERVFDMFRQVKISQVQIFFQIVFFLLKSSIEILNNLP